MKLSPAELAEVARQVAALPPGRDRAAPDRPGCRAQPLSCATLVSERTTLLGCSDD